MRVAIVHDAMVNAGGAERTVAFMCEAFPEAELFTSVYAPATTYPVFRERRVHQLPGARWVHNELRTKQLLPLWVAGFRRLALPGFDLVLSSTTFAAKHVRPPRGCRHACYCYAPFRWLWKSEVYSSGSTPLPRVVARFAEQWRGTLRAIDRAAMQRPDRVASTCTNMAREIFRCYGRHATVVHPPVRVSDYQMGTTAGGYDLVVGRLMSHKRVDVAIDACRALGRRLIVVGDGPERPALQRTAGNLTTFLGWVPDAQLKSLYAGCRAVLFPSHEDYGLVPLEANASGRPVVAYGAGGVLETMVDGRTALFFSPQSSDAMIDAIGRLDRMSFDAADIRALASRFDVPHFIDTLREWALAPTLGADRLPAERWPGDVDETELPSVSGSTSAC
jgi:glycosyltransferase involved in cell wall biosynthesis